MKNIFKVEASGWPSGIQNEVEKRVYIDEYSEREGVILEPANIKINKGLRHLA